MSRRMNPGKWNPWPVSIISFFAVAIAGCAAFVVFCNRQPPELVAADYYEQEVRYQGKIDSLQRAKQHGGAASVSYDPSAGSIVVAVPPGAGNSTLSGMVQLYRPSAEKLDRQLKLEPDRNGVQRIDAGSLSPGLWKVRVTWSVERQEYFMDQNIVIAARTS